MAASAQWTQILGELAGYVEDLEVREVRAGGDGRAFVHVGDRVVEVKPAPLDRDAMRELVDAIAGMFEVAPDVSEFGGPIGPGLSVRVARRSLIASGPVVHIVRRPPLPRSCGELTASTPLASSAAVILAQACASRRSILVVGPPGSGRHRVLGAIANTWAATGPVGLIDDGGELWDVDGAPLRLQPDADPGVALRLGAVGVVASSLSPSGWARVLTSGVRFAASIDAEDALTGLKTVALSVKITQGPTDGDLLGALMRHTLGLVADLTDGVVYEPEWADASWHLRPLSGPSSRFEGSRLQGLAGSHGVAALGRDHSAVGNADLGSAVPIRAASELAEIEERSRIEPVLPDAPEDSYHDALDPALDEDIEMSADTSDQPELSPEPLAAESEAFEGEEFEASGGFDDEVVDEADALEFEDEPDAWSLEDEHADDEVEPEAPAYEEDAEEVLAASEASSEVEPPFTGVEVGSGGAIPLGPPRDAEVDFDGLADEKTNENNELHVLPEVSSTREEPAAIEVTSAELSSQDLDLVSLDTASEGAAPAPADVGNRRVSELHELLDDAEVSEIRMAERSGLSTQRLQEPSSMPDPGALSIPDQATVAEPNRDRSHDETMDAFRPQLAGLAIASAETVDFAHAQQLQAATPFDTPQVESSLPSEGDFEEVTPHSLLLDDGASGLPEEIDSEGEGTLILPPGVMDAALAPSVQQVSTPNHTPPPSAPRDASGGKTRRPRRRRPLTGRGSGG